MNFLKGYRAITGAVAAHYMVNTHVDPESNS